MEMGERSKGKLSHASSRADRFHGDVASAEAYEYWKNQRGNPSLSNWQRERRQAGGTDNPGANYYVPDPYRRHKKLIPPNSSHVNYSPIENTDKQYRCPQKHRITRNKMANVNNVSVMRKGNEFKDVENDTDDDGDDEDDLGGEGYYEDDVNSRDEVEENHDESCDSETEKDRVDLGEEVDYEVSPPLERFPKKYEKHPMEIIERLKMLDLAQERLKLYHQTHFQKKFQEMVTRRGSQDIPEHDVTDEATEDDDDVSPHLLPIRKNTKQPTNYRQPSSWLASQNPDKYSPIRSSQNYHHPRKNENTKSSLEPLMESYGQKRTCRYCGGTGSYPESLVPRKNNCRIHESTKISFNTKEKFGVDGESGDPGERCSSGRRNSPRLNFANSPAALCSQKSRRYRKTRSPNRG